MKSPNVSCLDEPGNIDAPRGSRPWAVAVCRMIKNRLQNLDNDARNTADALDIADEYKAWQAMGYPSFGLFLLKEVGIDEDYAEAIRKARCGITLRTVAQQLAADPEVKPLADPHSRPGNKNASKEDNADSKTTPVPTGRGAKYIVARLKRDHPEIAEKLANGEYKSARAAGIAAGIVKVPTALDNLRKEWSKASEDERQEFLNEISNG